MNILGQVVSSQWLLRHLDDRELIIIDCRFQLAEPDWGYQQYLDNHIQGAYYLDLNRDLSAPVAKHGGRHPLPNPNLLADKLGAIGITSGQTKVIVYDDTRFAFASRLWWLLRYLGHSQVAVLDGGWNNWLKAGYPVSNQLPHPTSSNFTPQLHREWLVDRETVKQKLSSVVLIDGRESERYRGEREPIDPIAGSIPGAVNSPWKLVSDPQGYLLPISEQQKLWADYQLGQEIILYCGSGVTACVNLLSLELTGYQNTKLYVGGWSDWCSY
jgi:thiosulfate/3-mercaptopyruvate sulfurtransferase